MSDTNVSPPRALDRRQALQAAIAAGAIAITGGCSLLGLEWRYRYRLKAEIDTPLGLRSGSSVIEVIRSKGYTGIGGSSRGEAVAVDLPNGQTLFLLLRGNPGGVDWPFTIPHCAFQMKLGSSDMVSGQLLDRLTNMKGEQAAIEPKNYPAAVHFRNIRDPRSIEPVDLGDLNILGRDIMLKQIIIEITDDHVTYGIGNRFNWWSQYLDKHFDGSPATYEDLTSKTLSAHLSSRSFSSGISRAL